MTYSSSAASCLTAVCLSPMLSFNALCGVQVTQFSQMRRAGGVLGAIQDIYQKGGVQGFFKVWAEEAGRGQTGRKTGRQAL